MRSLFRVLTFLGLVLLNMTSNAIALPDFKSSPKEHLEALRKKFGEAPTVLIVEIASQKMHQYEGAQLLKTYSVSTSKYGIGSEVGSQKTPLGVHTVKEKFGIDAPKATIFKARVNSGQLAHVNTNATQSKADYVTSRILWLQGLESGKNRGRGVDSFKRYIYIHGTADEGLIGKPASHGCVRMLNDDVIELYNKVPLGTLVHIIR